MASDTSTPASSPAGYEFNTAQNEIIDALGWKMRLVGLIVLIFGLLNLLNAFLIQVVFFEISREKLAPDVFNQLTQIGQKERWIITGYLTVVGMVFACVGAWTRSAGGSFRQITSSKGRDISHLMDGFQTLHKMYSLIATAMVAAILGYVVLIVFKSSLSG